MFFWDPTMIVVIPAIILTMWAQHKTQSTFQKWARVHAGRGVTGADVARAILRDAGLDHVRVERVPGHLTDHYDPRGKVLRLSQSVHDSGSVAAVGVAAHEVGHAIQHGHGYAPLALRNGFVPLANIGSMGGPILAVIGFLFASKLLVEIGIVLFSLAVLFYLITLPVEFNASNRALAILEGGGYLTGPELKGARAVLWAAAMTYVASAAVAVSHLLRLLLLRGMLGSRDD